MSLELDVLRALLRLARRRSAPTLAQIADRVPGDEAAIRAALGSLATAGLVQRTPAGLRLSLEGLAVAVACAQRPRAKKGAARAALLSEREAAGGAAPQTAASAKAHRAA